MPGIATRDLQSREDCERLVRSFYEKAMKDAVIGWLFTDIAKLDLDRHMPKITDFWETLLLGARSYGGPAFQPHAALHARAPLREGHFARWLWLWEQSVDELFAGERAELAKAHARRVARAFHARLGGLPDPDLGQEARDGDPFAPLDAELRVVLVGSAGSG